MYVKPHIDYNKFNVILLQNAPNGESMEAQSSGEHRIYSKSWLGMKIVFPADTYQYLI